MSDTFSIKKFIKEKQEKEYTIKELEDLAREISEVSRYNEDSSLKILCRYAYPNNNKIILDEYIDLHPVQTSENDPYIIPDGYFDSIVKTNLDDYENDMGYNVDAGDRINAAAEMYVGERVDDAPGRTREGTLDPDGRGGLARLADRRRLQWRSAHGTDLVLHPAGLQFRLVVCLLYRPVATARPDRGRAVLAVHHGDHGAVLAARPVGGVDVCALHLLGELCCRTEFHHLAYELTPRLLDSSIDSDLEQNRNN